MIDTKKELGQHWLDDIESLKAIASATNLSKQDFVVEVGPGKGALTRVLAKQAGSVLALEFDQDLIAALERQFKGSNVSIEEADIRSFDLTKLPERYKICANIPYYLTANLLRKLADTAMPPEIAALLVQKEVAQKVAATDNRSMLATITQFKFKASLGQIVPAELFTPPPKIDSQVLILTKLDDPEVSWAELVWLIKSGFASPRKTLSNNLANALKMSKPDAVGLIESVGLKPSVRAEALANDDWLNLLGATKKPLI